MPHAWTSKRIHSGTWFISTGNLSSKFACFILRTRTLFVSSCFVLKGSLIYQTYCLGKMPATDIKSISYLWNIMGRKPWNCLVLSMTELEAGKLDWTQIQQSPPCTKEKNWEHYPTIKYSTPMLPLFQCVF